MRINRPFPGWKWEEQTIPFYTTIYLQMRYLNDILAIKNYMSKSYIFILKYNFSKKFIWNFILKSFNCNESITLTTHGELTFLHNLVPLLRRWQGPVSISIYTPGTDYSAALEAVFFYRSEELWKEYTNNLSFISYDIKHLRCILWNLYVWYSTIFIGNAIIVLMIYLIKMKATRHLWAILKGK